MSTSTYYYDLLDQPISVTYSAALTNSTISQYKVNSYSYNLWGECIDEPKQEPVKETAMSIEQNQTDYLTARASNVRVSLHAKLGNQFNLFVDNRPKTYKELIDAIKGGKYKLDEKRTKLIDASLDDDDEFGFCPYEPFEGIVWDGPQPDHKGHEDAAHELAKAHTKTLDAIKVLPAAEGLKALQEFENWVPSNLPKN